MRTATINRKTGETDISLTLTIDGRGRAEVGSYVESAWTEWKARLG